MRVMTVGLGRRNQPQGLILVEKTFGSGSKWFPSRGPGRKAIFAPVQGVLMEEKLSANDGICGLQQPNSPGWQYWT